MQQIQPFSLLSRTSSPDYPADKVRSPSIQPVLLLYLDIQAMEASMKLLRIELALLIGILVAASILISSMAQAGVAPP
jgi:hypothetical protein